MVRHRSALAAVALTLAVVGCGGSAPVGSDPPDISPGDTAPGKPETTAPGQTAGPPATTTTVPPPTTTTFPPPPPGSGVIVAFEAVLGWWSGSGWVQPDPGDPIPVEAGALYQVVRLDDPISLALGEAPGVGCEFVGTSGVALNPPLSHSFEEPNPVAVDVTWPIRPHLVEVVDPPPAVYTQIASDLLAGQGVIDPNPPIVQVVRADLEGDGLEEAFIVAERQTNALNPAVVGDYSVAFMRRVVEGQVKTAILDFFVVKPPEVEGQIIALDIFRFAAMADLNGDQKMEIVVNSQYYEGSGVTVWEYVNDDLGPVVVLGTGCGL